MDGDFVLNHWNAIWVIVLYFGRMIYDIVFSGNSMLQKMDRLKNMGPDLYWASIVLWGVILLNMNSKFFQLHLGNTPHVRFLILILLLALGPFISKATKFADDLTRGGAVKRLRRVVGVCAVYIPIHIVGAASFLIAFFLIGK
jgi:hypothetical protein